MKQLLADKDDLLTKIAAYKRTVDSLAGANETIRGAHCPMFEGSMKCCHFCLHARCLHMAMLTFNLLHSSTVLPLAY